MHLWRAKPLVRILAHDQLSAEQRAQYLLAGLLIYTVATYSGLLVGGTTPWSLPYVVEAVVVVAVAVLGVVRAFDASGGAKNSRFIVDFTCLYVPVSISTLVVVWGAYWLLRLAFGAYLDDLSRSDFQFALNLSALGMDILVFMSFVAIILVQVITFARIVSLLGKVREERGDA
jgi:hypothetical protein